MNSVYNAGSQSDIDDLVLGLSNTIKSLVTSDAILDPPDSEPSDVESLIPMKVLIQPMKILLRKIFWMIYCLL